METTTKLDKKQKLVGSDRFQPADFLIGRYVAKVPAGTKLEEVLHPQYFENHLDRMRSLMEVIVISDDGALDARLRVMTVTKTTARMRVLEVFSGEEPEAPKVEAETVTVGWGGPNHKWRVLHGKNIIETGFISEEEAKGHAAKYLASINS